MSVLEVERTPDWATWLHVPEVALWEGIALSLNIEPSKVEHDPDGRVFGSHLFDEQAEFHRRIFIASRNLGREPALEPTSIRIGQPENCQVSLSGFAAWACSIGWEVPPNFAEVGKRWTSPSEVIQSQVTKWPWGDHETELLQMLAAAAHQWWSTYDPEQKSTAPKNEEVIARRISRELSPEG